MCRSSLAAAFLAGLASAGITLAATRQGAERPPSQIAEDQAKTIQAALRDLEALEKAGQATPRDPRFDLWSRRRIEALRDRKAPKAEIVAALDDHLILARKAEKAAEAEWQSGRAPRVDFQDARFRALEAELWLAKARAE